MHRLEEPLHAYLLIDDREVQRTYGGREVESERRHLRHAVLRAAICLTVLLGGLAAGGNLQDALNRAGFPGDLYPRSPPALVDWFNHRRLLEPIGNIPPAKAEDAYYAALENMPVAWNKRADQPWTIMSIGLRDWAHRY